MFEKRYPHPTYPNVEATRMGRVFSNGQFMTACEGNIGVGKDGRELYPRVYIRVAGKQMAVHRVVFECVSGEALPTYERSGGGIELNHKDGDTRNAAFGNLEPVSHQENVRHSWEVLEKRQALAPGVLNASSKLSEGEVKEVIREYVAGKNCGQLGRQYGVDSSAVSRIIKGTQYQREVSKATEELGYAPIPGVKSNKGGRISGRQ